MPFSYAKVAAGRGVPVMLDGLMLGRLEPLERDAGETA
jgi:hypothetical protein